MTPTRPKAPAYRALQSLEAVAREWARRHLPALPLPAHGGAQRAIEMWLALRPPYESSHWSWRIVRQQWLRANGQVNPLAPFGRAAQTRWGRILASAGLWVGDVLSTEEADAAERFLTTAGAMRRRAVGAWDPLPAGSRLFTRVATADTAVCVFERMPSGDFLVRVCHGNRAYTTRRRCDATRRTRESWTANPAQEAAFRRSVHRKAVRAKVAVKIARATMRSFESAGAEEGVPIVRPNTDQ